MFLGSRNTQDARAFSSRLTLSDLTRLRIARMIETLHKTSDPDKLAKIGQRIDDELYKLSKVEGW